LDERDLFKEGAIALEALSETTNGDADSVVMNPTCQLPKFFEAVLAKAIAQIILARQSESASK
jgi:hypothetical protein